MLCLDSDVVLEYLALLGLQICLIQRPYNGFSSQILAQLIEILKLLTSLYVYEFSIACHCIYKKKMVLIYEEDLFNRSIRKVMANNVEDIWT
jgi:hypothetical protein